MSNFLKKALSAFPLLTIAGWFFPDLVTKFETWRSNKTPENMVSLGEAAAETLAGEFDPELLPTLKEDEHIADSAITAILSAAEEPSTNTIELALLETAKSSVTIMKNAGLLKRDIPEEDIQNAALPLFKLLQDAGLE